MVVIGATLALVAALLASCGNDDPGSAPPVAADADAESASWVDKDADAPTIASQTMVRGRVDLGSEAATERVVVHLVHARPTAIPAACDTSTVVRRRSYIDGALLRCNVAEGATSVTFDAIALGPPGTSVGGTVMAIAGGEVRRTALPERTILGGPATLSPDLRLLSSPDFLNADVGDLRKGPGLWSDMAKGRRSENSTNKDYERTLGAIFDDWQSLAPVGVLVAGDLVDGRWGYDDAETGNFGPVDTHDQQRAALRRAARTYYPQWHQRFIDHDLAPFPAMGDHEYGDNPYPRRKRELADDFRNEFAREFTTDDRGRPLFANHPSGPARLTAYAGRPTPDLQIVTIDVFDITPARARIGVDPQQLAWLRGVLAKAKKDRVQWIVVQGHTPILEPVRARGSSQLSYPGAERSRLWRLFSRYDVDLYLAGEVHDTTVKQQGGVTQITHGGAFQFGLTTALLMDFYGDRLYLSLRDYDVRHDSSDGRLWETRRAGLPRHISLVGDPVTIGTATLADGQLRGASGVLIPLD